MPRSVELGTDSGVDRFGALPNGQYSLVLQQDGNLVVYEKDCQRVWATGTDSQEIARATMQKHGNLVLYAANADAAWASDTVGGVGAYLVGQDDRNAVIYSADGDAPWQRIRPRNAQVVSVSPSENPGSR